MLQKDDNAGDPDAGGKMPDKTGKPLEGANSDEQIAMIRDLRAEQKERRIENERLAAELKAAAPILKKYRDLEEANKGEAEKLADRLAALEGQLSKAQSTATRAQNERKLTVLATKAGVNADMLQYLDVSKFDLEDEEATLAALSALVPAKSANSGGSANPARGNTGADGLTTEEWYKTRRNPNYIFGDK